MTSLSDPPHTIELPMHRPYVPLLLLLLLSSGAPTVKAAESTATTNDSWLGFAAMSVWALVVILAVVFIVQARRLRQASFQPEKSHHVVIDFTHNMSPHSTTPHEPIQILTTPQLVDLVEKAGAE